MVGFICFINRDFLLPINIALIFLLPIVYAAVTLGHLHAALVSAAAVLVFDFFFIPPFFTFSVMDKNYIVSFAIIIAMGQITAFLANKAKKAKELQISAEINNAIIGSISHELKTPLSAAIGALSCINKIQMPQEQKDELIKTSFEALKKMNRLTENLLDMARLEDKSLKLKLDEIEVSEIIYLILNKNPSWNLCFEDSDIAIKCDIGLIEILMTNLIENAIKYGNDIKVKTDENDSEILIEVQNTLKTNITLNTAVVRTKFARGANSNGIYGLGLGLCICEHIVNAHSGLMEIIADKTNFIVKVYIPKALRA